MGNVRRLTRIESMRTQLFELLFWPRWRINHYIREIFVWTDIKLVHYVRGCIYCHFGSNLEGFAIDVHRSSAGKYVKAVLFFVLVLRALHTRLHRVH